MSLINFSLTSPSIEPGDLLCCLETIIPQDQIAQAIEQTQSQQERKRSLPTHVVVALVMAMSFWATDSIVDVFKNLIAGKVIFFLGRVPVHVKFEVVKILQK